MEEIHGLTRKQLEGMISLQKQYYGMMNAEQRRKDAEARADSIIVMILIAIVAAGFGIYAFVNREPAMYIEERACLQYEKTDAMNLVGVGPNPLEWRAGNKSCVEYAEPTLRINPAYLAWLEEERALDAYANSEE